MRKLLILLCVLGSVLNLYANNRSGSTAPHLMQLPPFERACVLIRHFETLHKPKHWPTIGYGHLVKNGEKYKKRQYSHTEANIILRRDLEYFCSLYSEYGADSLLLACLAYNVGPERVNDSILLEKLERGDRNIRDEYISFSLYNGRRNSGLFRRRWMEYLLFFKP